MKNIKLLLALLLLSRYGEVLRSRTDKKDICSFNIFNKYY